jgi:tetratricopeptide (TPR) repeat protein
MKDRILRVSGAVAVVAAALLVPAAWGFDDLQEGITLFREGKFAQAEGKLRAATGAEASAYLGASLAKQKKYADAEAPAKTALAEKPTHDVAVAALGESLVGQKKYDEAIDRLGAAIKAKEDLAYAYFWRAQAYEKKSQPARMVADYETFLRLSPRAPEASVVQAILSAAR